MQELIALAKSKPGELNYASTGIGSAPHLSGELFMQRTGVKLVHVPYQGSPQAATDLLAGRVQVMFSPASAVVSLVQDGKLKVLASTGSKRAGILPDVPTMIESGMPDFDTSIWFGLMAPAGTPREVIDKLARAVREAVKSPEVVTAWRPQGVDPLDGGPDEFAQPDRERAQALGRGRGRRRPEEITAGGSFHLDVGGLGDLGVGLDLLAHLGVELRRGQRQRIGAEVLQLVARRPAPASAFSISA